MSDQRRLADKFVQAVRDNELQRWLKRKRRKRLETKLDDLVQYAKLMEGDVGQQKQLQLFETAKEETKEGLERLYAHVAELTSQDGHTGQ